MSEWIKNTTPALVRRTAFDAVPAAAWRSVMTRINEQMNNRLQAPQLEQKHTEQLMGSDRFNGRILAVVAFALILLAAGFVVYTIIVH